MSQSVGGKPPGDTQDSGMQRKLSRKGESLYQILDLEKGASADEVKKKYRKLALKYHPDKNPNNPEATAKFKEINNANRILQDEKKKEIYDKYGSFGLYIADQIGEDNLKAYVAMDSTWFKVLGVFCCLITGCCFGCCCCCCCCFCCCGKCKSEDPDEDLENFEKAEDLTDNVSDDEEDIVATDHPQPPIVIQPTISSENTPLTTAKQYPDYRSGDRTN